MKRDELITITLNKLPFGIELKRVYESMLNRCKDLNNKNYGGRGIKVCDEWKNDFMAFYKWAIENGYIYEPRATYNNYSKRKNVWSIERIDVNGNYEPSNCRWADDIVQNRNQRNKSEWKEKQKHLMKPYQPITYKDNDNKPVSYPYDNSPHIKQSKLKISRFVLVDEKGTHIINH